MPLFDSSADTSRNDPTPQCQRNLGDVDCREGVGLERCTWPVRRSSPERAEHTISCVVDHHVQARLKAAVASTTASVISRPKSLDIVEHEPVGMSAICALQSNSTSLPSRPLTIGRASGSCTLTSLIAPSGLAGQAAADLADDWVVRSMVVCSSSGSLATSRSRWRGGRRRPGSGGRCGTSEWRRRWPAQPLPGTTTGSRKASFARLDQIDRD